MTIPNETDTDYYISENTQDKSLSDTIPQGGARASDVKKIIENILATDVSPVLNTSSYVNVQNEAEERDIILKGMKINLADQTVYPQAFGIHNKVINMIGNLWNCPVTKDVKKAKCFAGSGTLGSTEACLLAGLALKFRWRHWYRMRHNLSMEETYAVRPNLVISSCFQAAWGKLFRYMDIEPRIITPPIGTFALDPSKLIDNIDENTIGVVGILGNHWSGHYDPIWEIDQEIEKINKKNNFQVGIHVDAASGGFIAPFQKIPAWDFRLKNVLSISTSGHKYGESCPGTGWVVWREKENLSEFIVTSVSYLGGNADSYNLNFSRPASGTLVQYYKLLRLGISGYNAICNQAMHHASNIRQALKRMKHNGLPRFILLDHGDTGCLPVVTARLNPACDLSYNDIDLQHILSSHHWYVGGYKMEFEHPLTTNKLPLLNDMDQDNTMFRIVIKGNITKVLVQSLIEAIEESIKFLDRVEFKEHFDKRQLRNINNRIVTSHC